MQRHHGVSLAALAGLAAASVTNAQYVMVNSAPGTFLDISSTGTAITGVLDDTVHTIETSVGNALFPAGFVTVCSNGFMCAGSVTGAPFTNNIIPTSGMPAALTPGTQGYLIPFWDDLYGTPAPDTTIYWQEVAGMLVVQWHNISHFADTSGANTIDFEVKVFATPSGGVYIQYLYADTEFGPGFPGYDNGISATVGYANDANTAANNMPYSFNTASVHSGDVLSIVLDVTGRCCLPDGSCAVIAQGSCNQQGGVFGGGGTNCVGANCPQPGACCATNGTCSILQAAACAAAGGLYRGDGTVCATANCPPPCTLITNGDFETGTFSSWTQFGNTGFTGVNTGVWVVVAPHGGIYESHFGPVGTTGGIQQTITANAGDMVRVDFWYACNITTPNYFSADLGTTHLIDFTDDVAHEAWTHFTFTIPAPSANPVLTFTTRHDPQYVYLDDIEVSIPANCGGASCYANCDTSTQQPCLNVLDFTCFLNSFAASSTYANCDASTNPPVLNVLDFTCFLNQFAAGCSSC